MPNVRPERTGWRDEAISRRHRDWGFDCPCIDVDFLVTEFDRAEPVALVEYKHESAPVQFASHKSYRALMALGRRAKVPVFAVRYTGDFTNFRITPLTKDAKAHVGGATDMDEAEYVRFLYRLRGQVAPIDVLLNLKTPV